MVTLNPYDGLLEKVNIPGLTTETQAFYDLRDNLSKDLAVLRYKEQQPLAWVVFVGGTGTGKSTLFNSLCGAQISRVGVERPTTDVPVVYIHATHAPDETFPFSDVPIRGERDEPGNHNTGKHLIVSPHTRDDISHLALVDTPDLDSLDLANRRITEDLYRLADLIVFVTSQEKYADEIPSRMLSRVAREGKPCLFLFNKADPDTTRDEVVAFFRKREMALDDKRVWLIPYTTAPSPQRLAEEDSFVRFTDRFYEIVREGNIHDFLADQRQLRIEQLRSSLESFRALLEREKTAGDRWLFQLDALFEEQGRALFHQFETHFKQDNQGHIQREIGKIYSRYDILSKPRHYIKEIVLTPLTLLGLRDRDGAPMHKKDLEEIRKQTDVTPILSAISAVNRRVLEDLHPDDQGSPFAAALQQDALVLSDSEIRAHIERLQEGLMAWIEQKFRDLAKGIPKYKEVGIYSTAIIWGGLILSFEIVIGGGIGVIEAALDSFLAPLVTKGSVSLFAYHEIQGIARELDAKYREGIQEILKAQKERYVSCMEPFLIGEETITGLEDLKAEWEQ
ncbi:MAG: GTPase domain-containing protein [Deltaproteobacteria bacterium]|nr:GTPase domain-containing protein [Deltaproteobacteria bacterium]